MNYKEACEKAKEIDRSLLVCIDLKDFIYLSHSDGSKCMWSHANLKEDGEWIFIFTEHHGYFVYHKEDVKYSIGNKENTNG